MSDDGFEILQFQSFLVLTQVLSLQDVFLSKMFYFVLHLFVGDIRNDVFITLEKGDFEKGKVRLFLILFHRCYDEFINQITKFLNTPDSLLSNRAD